MKKEEGYSFTYSQSFIIFLTSSSRIQGMEREENFWNKGLFKKERIMIIVYWKVIRSRTIGTLRSLWMNWFGV